MVRQNRETEQATAPDSSSAGVPPVVFLPTGGALAIRGRRLPHWETEGGVYFVTFRLADSLPSKALDRIKFTRKDVIQTAAQMGRNLTIFENRKMQNLHAQRIETILDAGS
jgi:hypothetical protein